MGARAVIAVAVAAVLGGAPGAADRSWGSRGVVRVPLGRSVKFVKAERVAFPRGSVVVLYGSGSLATSFRVDAAWFDTRGRFERRMSTPGVPVAVDAQGRLLLNDGYRIGRLTASGRLDTSFGTNGWVRVASGTPCGDAVADVEPAPGGDVAVVALPTCDPNAQESLRFPYRVYRFLGSGRADASFGGGRPVETHVADAYDLDQPRIAVDARGRIVVAAATTAASAVTGFVLERFVASGGVDRSFGRGGRAGVGRAGEPSSRTLLVTRGGDVVLSGCYSGGTGYEPVVFRLRADGTAAPGWISDALKAVAAGDDVSGCVRVDADRRGRVYVAARSVYRLAADGTVEKTWASGRAAAIGVDGAGRVVTAGALKLPRSVGLEVRRLRAP